jgi:hypothetical protein
MMIESVWHEILSSVISNERKNHDDDVLQNEIWNACVSFFGENHDLNQGSHLVARRL